MDDYGVAGTAAVLLAVLGFRTWLAKRRQAAADAAFDASGGLLDGAELIEEHLEIPPHGVALLLRGPGARVSTDAVFQKLKRYSDGSLPFAGLIVDVADLDYRFSTADLAAAVSATAAWIRGWVAPCAFVLHGQAAADLQRMIDVSKLGSIEQLRIVRDLDEARAHVAMHARGSLPSDSVNH